VFAWAEARPGLAFDRESLRSGQAPSDSDICLFELALLIQGSPRGRATFRLLINSFLAKRVHASVPDGYSPPSNLENQPVGHLDYHILHPGT
jgi:hypothetical protein